MYDLIILGGGPAGYVAAEKAGALGKSVLLVDSGEHGGGLGGVCLNSGCIPTKSMLYPAKLYEHARHAEAFGVRIEGATFDYAAVKARTEGIQDQLRKGIAGMMKKAKVEVVNARGRLAGPTAVEAGGTTYEGKHILVCTGSRPFVPPIPGLDGNDRVVTNETILKLEEMPKKLCIIGAGVIGTEYACLYASAGREVTVIEMLPKICGPVDNELAKTVQKRLQKRSVEFHLKATVTSVDGGKVCFQDKKGTEQSVDADTILVATGRRVNTDDIGLETARVDFDRSGIKVDERARTNIPTIRAAGDVTGRWQLAHFASRQATVAVRDLFGIPQICREDAIPSVVYTDPEIASVGLTEAQAKERGLEVKAAKAPMQISGRYLAETDGERGVCKVVADAGTDRLLGIHMVGPYVSEMIAAGAVALEAELRASDLDEVVFPHPTIGEVIHEVAGMLTHGS